MWPEYWCGEEKGGFSLCGFMGFTVWYTFRRGKWKGSDVVQDNRVPGVSRNCGSGASRSGGRPQPSPVHSFASTDFQQEALENPREKNEICPQMPCKPVSEKGGCSKCRTDYGEDKVPPGKKETGPGIPIIKADVNGERGTLSTNIRTCPDPGTLGALWMRFGRMTAL